MKKSKNEKLNLVRFKDSKELFISTKLEGSYVITPIGEGNILHLDEDEYNENIKRVKGKIKFS